MDAVSFPILPIFSHIGTVGFPILPATSIRGGKNGSGQADLYCSQRAQRHRRPPERKDASALVEVLRLLLAHSLVAWCERMNTGTPRGGDCFLQYGGPGCPDALAHVKGGRLLGCESEGPASPLRPAQVAFLERIRAAGGISLVACDGRDVRREMKALKGAT